MTDPAFSTIAALLKRLTALMLRGSGEGTLEISDAVQRVATAYGATAVLLVLPDSVLLVVRFAGNESTIVINERAEVPRLDQLTTLRQLIHAIEAGSVPLEQAMHQLQLLEAAPPLYPPWATVAGVTLLSLGFGLTLQATWQEAIASLVLGTLVGLLALLPRAQPKLSHLMPFVAATIVSALVLALYAPAGLRGAPINLMIPALLYFIPGDFISASMLELAHGRVAAGAIRLVHALFQLLTLAVGVTLGGILVGTHPNEAFRTAVTPEFGAWVLVVGWVIFAAGMVWCMSIRWRDFGWVVTMILFADAVQEAGTLVLGELGSTFIAGAAVACVAGLLARNVTRPPYLVLMLGAFFVLTVGTTGLDGLSSLADGDLARGFTSVADMFGIASALSLGLLTGNIIESLFETAKSVRKSVR